MRKTIFISIFGLSVGILIALIIIIYAPLFEANKNSSDVLNPLAWHKHQSIGFLPYWLIGAANSTDINNNLTTLAYFALRVTGDGTIMHATSPQQSEPGWLALNSGRADVLFHKAKAANLDLSLLVASGDQTAINQLIQDPIKHADTLILQISPVMQKYGFTDLNLDIESTQTASPEAQSHFTQFIAEVKKKLVQQNKSLTLEISTIDLINPALIAVSQVAQDADYIVLMAYDYHSTVSTVTGPVAPLYGGENFLEYDTSEAIEKMLTALPASKIILGIPTYGYEWDTLDNTPQSAIIPGTGATISNSRAESVQISCASCSAQFDQTTKEAYIIYSNGDLYHQIFYPNKQSIEEKINFADTKKLAGIAIWALGYNSNDMLSPLATYK